MSGFKTGSVNTIIFILFHILPIVAVLILAVLWFLDMTELAILGVYAIVPMLSAPIIYRVSTINGDPPNVFLNRRIAMSLIFFLLSIATVLSAIYPRPYTFFIIMALTHTLCILFIFFKIIPPGLGVSIFAVINYLFFVSTTLFSGFFIGSADTIAIWVGIYDSLNLDTIVATAGYGSVPAYFYLTTIVGQLIGGSAISSLLIVGASISTMVIFFTYFFASKSVGLNRYYSAIASGMVLYMYPHFFEGLQSIPRSFSYTISIISISLLTYIVLNNNSDNRLSIVLVIILPTLAISHKGEQLVPIIIIIFLLIVNLVYKNHNKINIRTTIMFVSLLIIPYLYVISNTLIPDSILRLVFFTTTDTGGTGRFVLDSPLALALTFVSATTVLIFFLSGVKSIAENEMKQIYEVALTGIVCSILYFPGPGHMLGSVLFRRAAKYAIPFIVIVCVIGYVSITLSNKKIIHLIVFFLLLSGSFFTLSNDMYSRDNPIQQTDTFSNYLTHDEMASINFIERNGGDTQITVDLQTNLYIHRSIEMTTTYESSANLNTASNIEEICGSQFLYRGREVRERGSVIYPEHTRETAKLSSGGFEQYYLENKTHLENYNKSSKIYINGDNIILDLPNCDI